MINVILAVIAICFVLVIASYLLREWNAGDSEWDSKPYNGWKLLE